MKRLNFYFEETFPKMMGYNVLMIGMTTIIVRMLIYNNVVNLISTQYVTD